MSPLKNGKLPPGSILVDRRNWDLLRAMLTSQMQIQSLVGIDIETNDANRHAGLNRAMKTDEEGFKGGNTALLFDTKRTIVTGFSIYYDGDTFAYYFNIGHADVENRLHFHNDGLAALLDHKPAHAFWIAHNAPYELTFLKEGWGAVDANNLDYAIGYDLGENVICTLQMAVTAYNEDTYPIEALQEPGLGGIEKLFGAVKREYLGWNPGQELTKEQEELIYKITAKESTSEFSYNGFVSSIAFGYGLKRMALTWLGYEQTSFETVMRGRAHMGQLTGEEVAAYGADDAWVCVYLYHELLNFLLKENPQVVATFFSQENPMVQLYSKVWREGVKINLKKVKLRKEEERVRIATTLSTMKEAIRYLLPFPEDVHEKLVKYDPKLYGKTVGGEYVTAQRYRREVVKWASSSDLDDPFEEVYKVKTSLSKQWAADKGRPEPTGISLTYYQVVRCVVLDLCRLSFQLSEGKVQSDADALGRMKDRLIKKAVTAGLIVWDEKEEEATPIPPVTHDTPDFQEFSAKLTVLQQYESLKATDQAIKLYLAPYENLTDPDTGRVHPILSSMLNSRRMAMKAPNLNQLAKFSASAYVREFFESDDQETHVIVTADYSAVELVLIGDASGDPTFFKAYGQVPHQDIHSLTASGLLDMSLEDFNKLPDKKQIRTDLGKPANFGYWFSGALGTVAKELGWTSDQMWEYVEKYRATYPVAEQWRLETIQEAQIYGKVRLPDQHMRYRLESTPYWMDLMRNKFYQHGQLIGQFGDMVLKKIARRSGNQAVNSKIQGTGGTLAKRSAIAMQPVIRDEDFRARFIFPCHDELAFSVHKDDAVRFSERLRTVMCDHPEIVKTMKLSVAVAMGLNYGAWHATKNPRGQIEMDEASKVPCLPEERWGQYLTLEERQTVVEYLFRKVE